MYCNDTVITKKPVPNNLYKHSVQYNFTVIKKDTKEAEVKAIILKRCVYTSATRPVIIKNTPKNATYDYSLRPDKSVLVGH